MERRRSRPATLVVVFVMAVVVALALRWRMQTPSGSVAADGRSFPAIDGGGMPSTVVEVIDGDTLRLRMGDAVETVRLLGIDTPESVHPTVPDQCFGAEATAALSVLLPPGTSVEVYRDHEARDHYDRLLLWVIRSGDRLDVNHSMVREGYAAASFYEPNTARRSALLGAERQARADRLGLWGVCDGPDQPLD